MNRGTGKQDTGGRNNIPDRIFLPGCHEEFFSFVLRRKKDRQRAPKDYAVRRGLSVHETRGSVSFASREETLSE